MFRTISMVRLAFWRAFKHGVFMNAKGAAYSSILTLFPALIVVAWLLAATQTTDTFLQEIAAALGRVLPPGSRTTAIQYLENHNVRPVKEIVSASTIMVLAASGVMISWMTAFRSAYQVPQTWGFWRERAVALFLVLLGFIPMAFAMGLVAFGNQIETWVVTQGEWIPKFYVLLIFNAGRWLVAFLTSVTVIALIYHWGVPRVQPWSRVLPGAVMATMLWFPVTLVFGFYVTHYSTYNLIYGPLGAAIALLVWLYIISIIIMVGAEFNALACPREVAGPPVENLGGRRKRRLAR